MSAFASIARAALGAMPIGTLNQKTLTFAIMEFLMDTDSNAIKSQWLKWGFKDLSPIWGDKTRVPTFKDKLDIIKQWPSFQKQMVDVEADWYYLSGHHAAEYGSDGAQVDDLTFINTHQYVGFFNEPYHTGPWEQTTRGERVVGASEKDVFMYTSRADWVYDLDGPSDNPLYSAPHPKCKGVILVGCNGLSYKSVRKMYKDYFPNAVIIGAVSKESNAIAKILPVIRKHGRSFFSNPKSVDPADLALELNPSVGTVDRLAVMSEGWLYYVGKNPRGVNAMKADEDVT